MVQRLAFAALVLLAACKGAPNPEEAAHAEERMNLLTNPNLYLPTSDREYEGEYGDDTDHQVTSMVVNNTSHFAVGELAGDVVWFDDQDRRLGSTPFSLVGSIPAGQAKRFSVSDATLQSGKLHGVAGAVQVVFAHLKLVDPEKRL
jgi:hypothetical protein